MISIMETQHHSECLAYPYLLHLTDGGRALVGECDPSGTKVVLPFIATMLGNKKHELLSL